MFFLYSYCWVINWAQVATLLQWHHTDVRFLGITCFPWYKRIIIRQSMVAGIKNNLYNLPKRTAMCHVTPHLDANGNEYWARWSRIMHIKSPDSRQNLTTSFFLCPAFRDRTSSESVRNFMNNRADEQTFWLTIWWKTLSRDLLLDPGPTLQNFVKWTFVILSQFFRISFVCQLISYRTKSLRKNCEKITMVILATRELRERYE